MIENEKKQIHSRADEYRKRRRNISLEDLKSVSINMHVCKQAKVKIFDWFYLRLLDMLGLVPVVVL